MACEGKNITRAKIRKIAGLLKAKKYIVYTLPYQ